MCHLLTSYLASIRRVASLKSFLCFDMLIYQCNSTHFDTFPSRLTGRLLVALFPDPEQEGLLGRNPEALVQRWASGRNRAAAGRAARQGGARVQTGQRLHGGLTGAERQATGQLLNLKEPATHTFCLAFIFGNWVKGPKDVIQRTTSKLDKITVKTREENVLLMHKIRSLK